MIKLLCRMGLLCALSIFLCPQSEAYNYLNIHPSTGEPVRWDNTQTIKYYLDPGGAGRFSNDQIHTLLKEMMKLWENASPDAEPPKFEFAGFLDEDVNGTNYEKYVTKTACYESDLSSCPTEAQKNLKTVVVIDEDGSIFSGAKLCPFTNCGAVAGPRVFSGAPDDPGFIKQGFIVIGSVSEDVKVSAFAGLILHELGHLLGLAHPYLNQQFLSSSTPEDAKFFPTMMTGVAGQDDQLAVTLNPDDIAGIATIYPSEPFATATIKGRVLKSDGSPMIHVNVIIRDVDDPLCKAYSFISGRICEAASTTLCESSIFDDSSYMIQGLPAGSYKVEVEEVTDKSMASTLAPGLIEPFISGDSEFWNASDAANESNTLSTTITLTPGEIRENIDIILNRSEVTEDRIKFLPLALFEPGPATLCPEAPPVDYAALIGVDETEPPTPDPTPTPSSSGGCSLLQ